MNIRTKSQLNTMFLVVVILMIGLILFFTSHKMNAAIEKEKAIDNLNTGIFELTLMTHDYLLNYGTRTIIQWQARYASLGKVLGTGFQTPEEKVLLEEIKQNYDKLKTIFSKLTINYQAWSNRKEIPGDFKQLESRLAGHMMTRLQTMVSLGNQLVQRSDRELISIQRGASLVIMFSIFMFAVMIAVNSILMGRSIVRPIRKLQKDIEIVGKGNLDYPLATAANDELGELSRSFEQMAKNLKTVMGSRDELEHEIEDRKQAELKLKESEEKYSKLFHSNPQWLHISTLEDGRYVEVNEATKEITGYERDELIGRTSKELGLWADYEERSRLVKVAKEQGGFRDQEVTFIKKNGEPVSLLWSAATIEIMGTAYFINSVADITERKQAEEALRESEEKFRTVLGSNPDPVVVYDMAGRVTYLNHAFTRVFGWSLEEQIGKKIDNFVPEENWPETRMMINKVTELGESFSGLETRRYTKEGNVLDISISGSCYRDQEGKISASVINLRDITAQKRLEVQLHRAQKMEAMGTLAGGIAHDFNNLLMAIQGRTSIMLNKKDSSHPDIRHLRGIEDNIESAADLTRQLLGFARGGKYEVRPTDLNELIKKQNRMFGRTKKEITIRGKYEKDLWSVEVDRGQIEQVLLNLYVNAWQAMPAGGDLNLETENVTLDENYEKPFSIEPGRYVKISVTDTGVGMDKATREKIFEPFFTTKEMGRGTGLGLASVYGIIKNHGGFINVYSEKGHGTIFNIYLPASEKGVIEEKKPAGDTLRGSETVLFVDDEDMIIEIAEELFEQLGYKVLIARSGREAIETYEKNKDHIDIVLLDMIMPDMSGSDTYDRMKKIDPDIKVLLFSGYSINGRATEILDRGCNGFIQKPFKMKELSQKLREILDS